MGMPRTVVALAPMAVCTKRTHTTYPLKRPTRLENKNTKYSKAAPTVRESPRAATTLISPAFTNSTGRKNEIWGKSRGVRVCIYETVSEPPEEGAEGEGLISGHWKAGCLKPTGRVLFGNSWREIVVIKLTGDRGTTFKHPQAFIQVFNMRFESMWFVAFREYVRHLAPPKGKTSEIDRNASGQKSELQNKKWKRPYRERKCGEIDNILLCFNFEGLTSNRMLLSWLGDLLLWNMSCRLVEPLRHNTPESSLYRLFDKEGQEQDEV